MPRIFSVELGVWVIFHSIPSGAKMPRACAATTAASTLNTFKRTGGRTLLSAMDFRRTGGIVVYNAESRQGTRAFELLVKARLLRKDGRSRTTRTGGWLVKRSVT